MLIAALLDILILHLSFATWIWESWYSTCFCAEILWIVAFVSLIATIAENGI